MMLKEFFQMFTFKIKYRRKCIRYWPIICYTIIALAYCCTIVSGKCSDVNSCMNGGVCGNGTCVCADGWQGNECQFCGGKVRLTDLAGNIHDGVGNYSVGVKCSWLIDARDHKSYGLISHEQKKPSIRLHLEEFATECGWDHLYVFDGDSVESPLLAVFSGLMYRKNFSIRRVPEVVAHSGSVLLHFYSDDAYNMSGFNISYKINGCPTIDSSVNCSGHGVCLDGTCTCDGDYMGSACHVPKCLNNCSYSLNQGICDPQAHSCFLLLLLMAAILWKIKQKYDMFRRRQRLFVEMEQMASRPFSQVMVDIETRDMLEISPAAENCSHAQKKCKKDSPSLIALEPCNGNRAAVLSLLVRLPTGGLQHSPPGQAAGLAVASALVTLGNPNPRRPSVELPKEP